MVPTISVEDLKDKRDRGEPITVLDVREPWELAIAALDDVLAIPMAQVPAEMESLPRDHPLLVLCRSGARSARVVEWLESQGFANAANIDGGILAWAEKVDPTISTY